MTKKTQMCLLFQTSERNPDETIGLKVESTPAKLCLLKQLMSRPPTRKEQFGDGMKAGGARQTGKLGQALCFKHRF